jgi:hypothetical protein
MDEKWGGIGNTDFVRGEDKIPFGKSILGVQDGILQSPCVDSLGLEG